MHRLYYNPCMKMKSSVLFAIDLPDASGCLPAISITINIKTLIFSLVGSRVTHLYLKSFCGKEWTCGSRGINAATVIDGLSRYHNHCKLTHYKTHPNLYSGVSCLSQHQRQLTRPSENLPFKTKGTAAFK